MKSVITACLVGSTLICAGCAQDLQNAALRQGISVQMPIASHAVETPGADAPNSTVVAITGVGKVFVGIRVTEPGELANLSDETVYVKADARVPFEKVLAVLDALRGKSVVLLSSSPEKAASPGILRPYGTRLIVSR